MVICHIGFKTHNNQQDIPLICVAIDGSGGNVNYWFWVEGLRHGLRLQGMLDLSFIR